MVVPARNEAALLPETLPTLLGQDYPGSLTVVLVDDHSSDGTAEVARRYVDERHGLGRPGRLLVVPAADLPAGWTGKVWAMAQGLAAAPPAAYVLFTDADIAHPADSVTRLVRRAVVADADLVSVMVRLRLQTRWEALVIPAFVYFFRQLYPFRWVGDPARRAAAAAGGSLLVRRDALAAVGDLTAMRDAVIDDVALARLVKHATRPGGGHIELHLGDDVTSRRPYPHLADLWQMVTRSAYAQLRHRPLLLAGTVAGLAFAYLLPPVATVAGAVALGRHRDRASLLTAVGGGTAWAVMTMTYRPMVRYYRLPAWRALTLPLSAALYLAMTLDSAWRHYRGRGAGWKGRTYEGPAAATRRSARL